MKKVALAIALAISLSGFAQTKKQETVNKDSVVLRLNLKQKEVDDIFGIINGTIDVISKSGIGVSIADITRSNLNTILLFFKQEYEKQNKPKNDKNK